MKSIFILYDYPTQITFLWKNLNLVRYITQIVVIEATKYQPKSDKKEAPTPTSGLAIMG